MYLPDSATYDTTWRLTVVTKTIRLFFFNLAFMDSSTLATVSLAFGVIAQHSPTLFPPPLFSGGWLLVRFGEAG